MNTKAKKKTPETNTLTIKYVTSNCPPPLPTQTINKYTKTNQPKTNQNQNSYKHACLHTHTHTHTHTNTITHTHTHTHTHTRETSVTDARPIEQTSPFQLTAVLATHVGEQGIEPRRSSAHSWTDPCVAHTRLICWLFFSVVTHFWWLASIGSFIAGLASLVCVWMGGGLPPLVASLLAWLHWCMCGWVVACLHW